jgi:hypothetical protein
VSEKVSLATLPSFLFILIEINKRARWLIVDTDDRTQMLTKRVTLWLLLFDYAHTIFSHTTPKCIAVCAVNSIDYAYFYFIFFHFNFLFAHHVEHKSTWLWSVIHANRYLPAYYRECVCVMSAFCLFRNKKVSVNIIWWESLVCMCGEDGLCLFSVCLLFLSLIVGIRKWASACACVNTGQKKSDAFDVTNLIGINRNEYFLFSWDIKKYHK